MENKKNISKHPFKTPENYFSKLTDDITQAVQGEYVPKSLQEISKEKVYTTPENYFEELPQIIQNRVQNKNKASWTIHWGTIISPALAAMLVIGFFIAKSLFNTPQTAEELLSSVSTKDLIAYIDVENLNNDEILDLIGDSDIQLEMNITNDLQLDEETFRELNISEIDELDDYLIDDNSFENIEPEDLL